MRLKEIKPGMAIYCITEAEAMELLWYLHRQGYRWNDGEWLTKTTYWEDYKENTCYLINDGKAISYADVKFYKSLPEKYKYIRYTDLILPELTAEEVLEIMKEICHKHQCGNMCPLYDKGLCLITETDFNVNRVIEICAQWKADHEKKEPEFEWVDICRIIKVYPSGRKKCVHEEDITERELPFGGIPEKECERVLKKYIAEHEGEYFAVAERVCRVKEQALRQMGE